MVFRGKIELIVQPIYECNEAKRMEKAKERERQIFVMKNVDMDAKDNENVGGTEA